MEILRNKEELLRWRAECVKYNNIEFTNIAESKLSAESTSMKYNASIGYIPTMGALHGGHLSLVKRSKKENDFTILSIFVNPTQFGINEDFDKYPRLLEKDLDLCRIDGVDAVFVPSVDDMYSKDEETILVPPSGLSNVFEGAIRSSHFSGVLRVVLKFFNLIRPQNAYFGQKDAQQLLIIKKMVSDLFLNLNIVGCPIVRDCNGLAMSSRNVYLDEVAYNRALSIPRAVNATKEAFTSISDARLLEAIAMEELTGLEVDYCSIVDYNLNSIDKVLAGNAILLIAARVCGVRLIDNLWF